MSTLALVRGQKRAADLLHSSAALRAVLRRREPHTLNDGSIIAFQFGLRQRQSPERSLALGLAVFHSTWLARPLQKLRGWRGHAPIGASISIGSLLASPRIRGTVATIRLRDPKPPRSSASLRGPDVGRCQPAAVAQRGPVATDGEASALEGRGVCRVRECRPRGPLCERSQVRLWPRDGEALLLVKPLVAVRAVLTPDTCTG